MRCLIHLSALLLALAAMIWWAAAGARIGWWQTRVGVERTDEITGLSVIEWQERFAPGIETPVLGLIMGGALYGSTYLLRRKPTPNQNTK